ncbi:cubilin-like [Physella acuta]|uniref:cubilin-like n=1 Tax=Physella acuta TaxID=109671 RepID=UPI0027DE0C43|nr:cubilin-like [Physella acuta]
MDYKTVAVIIYLIISNLLSPGDADSAFCVTDLTSVGDSGQPCPYSTIGRASNGSCWCNSDTHIYNTCAATCIPLCNRTVTERKGTIASPGYPIASGDMSTCTWTIRGWLDHDIVAFNLAYFNMSTVTSTSGNCATDYIEIFDGYSATSRSFGKMCSHNQSLFVSTANYLHVVFRTVGTGRFLATYIIHYSQLTLDESKGFLYSPGYPIGSSSHTTYRWIIQGKPCTHIVINITSVHIGANCASNYLKVYDEKFSLLRTSCASNVPVVMASTANYLYLEYKTDGSTSNKGFYGSYEIRETLHVYQADSGYVFSPGFPYRYNDNVNVSWLIRASAGTFVHFNISSIQLEGSYPGCPLDYIQIYDGSNTTSAAFPRLCDKHAQHSLIVSTSNEMFIVFKTDRSVTYTGFNASFYAQGKDKTLYESGKLASPGYPLKYLNSQTLSWTLVTRIGTYLVLNISYLQTQGDGKSCVSDYVKVYDGSSTSSRTLGTFCGSVAPVVVASTSTHMHVTFTTDSSSTYTGFYGEFFSQGNTLPDIKCNVCILK